MKKQPAISKPKTGTGTALLVIDVQKGLFKQSKPIYRAEALLDNICLLAERAHSAGVPVFYIQHTNEGFLAEDTDGWQLHTRILPEERDHVLQKKHGSAFQKTDLEKELEARNVGTVVIAGLVTHGCVRATCLAACELGYRVILVEDGHSSYHKQAGALIVEWNQKLSEAGAELKPTQNVHFMGTPLTYLTA